MIIKNRHPLFVFLCLIFLVAPLQVGAQGKQQDLVDRAELLLRSFNDNSKYNDFRKYVPYAHAVLIIPSYIRGAFGFGLAGGPGVMMRRDIETGKWSSPAFYSLRSLSAGLQAGGSSSEVIMFITTERGLQSINRSALKLEFDTSVAVGQVGYGLSGWTPINMSRDFIAFMRGKGVYIGASLEGGSLVVKKKWNRRYYNSDVQPLDILTRVVSNPNTIGLQDAMQTMVVTNPLLQ